MQEQDSIHAVVALTDDDFIKSRIFTIRDVQVILSSDLAPLYDVEVKYLHRQVRRNENRFPSDFVLHLTPEEANALRCQNVTSKRGGDRYGANYYVSWKIAFPEHLAKIGLPFDDAYALATQMYTAKKSSERPKKE